MIYIHTALKSEAQAFVDKFKLKKNEFNHFTIFSNENIILIISGVGIINTNKSLKELINNFNISKDDVILNIGICGSNKKYKIGELIEIGNIYYKNNIYIIDKKINTTITCLENECNQNIYEIVDMESFAFYEQTKSLNNVRMFKVVSDHFEPSTITKDKTKSLIFNKLGEIIEKSNYNWS